MNTFPFIYFILRYFWQNPFGKNIIKGPHHKVSKYKKKKLTSPLKHYEATVNNGNTILEFAKKFGNGIRKIINWTSLRKLFNKNNKRFKGSNTPARLAEKKFQKVNRYPIYILFKIMMNINIFKLIYLSL